MFNINNMFSSISDCHVSDEYTTLMSRVSDFNNRPAKVFFSTILWFNITHYLMQTLTTSELSSRCRKQLKITRLIAGGTMSQVQDQALSLQFPFG